MKRRGFLGALAAGVAGIALGKDKPLEPLHPTVPDVLSKDENIPGGHCILYGSGEDIIFQWDGTDFDIVPVARRLKQ